MNLLVLLKFVYCILIIDVSCESCCIANIIKNNCQCCKKQNFVDVHDFKLKLSILSNVVSTVFDVFNYFESDERKVSDWYLCESAFFSFFFSIENMRKQTF